MNIEDQKKLDDHTWKYAIKEADHIADEVMMSDQEDVHAWDFTTTFFWLLVHGYINLEEDEN